MKWGITLPACFDEPFLVEPQELSPSTLEALIEDLSSETENHPHLARMRECLEHLKKGN